MELEDLLIPIPDWLTTKNYLPYQIGSQVLKYDNKSSFPEIKEGSIVFFGLSSSDDKFSFSKNVRLFFYPLISHFTEVNLIDIGDVVEGKTFEDTCEVLSTIVSYCISNHALPVYLGFKHHEMLGIYNAYEKMKKIVNIATIDALIDADHQRDQVDEINWVTYLINREPNYLFNFSALAFQSYYVQEQILDLFEKLHFDLVRVGKIHQNLIHEVEPVIRSSDIVSVDLNSVRFADFPATTFLSPNGLTGEEICQIMRIAGMNENLSALAVFGDVISTQSHNETLTRVSYSLIAQMLWYFVHGYYNRPHENPYVDKEGFLKYIVANSELKTEFVFYKSNISNRWWMEVPFSSKSKPNLERHLLIPCTYDDYQEALNNIIPARWWKTYQKLL
ncbi:MAG: arginase family protein [Bacteroidales bacterium]|nr:arginase family protein [Bacteroidales bacterium]